jgi:hypothetical protein
MSIFKIYYRISLVFSVLIFLFIYSCKKADWYDVKPYNSLAVPQSLKDMQALMDNGELSYSGPSLGEVGSDGHYISDGSFSSLTGMDINAYTWTHKVPYQLVQEWSLNNRYGAYSRVYYCNLVLEGLGKIKPINSDEENQKNYIKGQALFHRSRSFYDLSQVFAPPFNATSAATDLSIPLRLESDINIKSTRSTVKETYDRIVNDLIEASSLLPSSILPDNDLNKSRPTKAAVSALLARIYLSMEDYSNAGKYANECLNAYSALLDYSTLDSTSFPPFPVFNQEVIWQGVMSGMFLPISSSLMLIDSSLYNLYDNSDLRKPMFFISASPTDITFQGYYTGGDIPFTGLATDEQYLIRAESHARAGDKTSAMKDLNTLLKTRWSNDVNGLSLYVDMSATDADDALHKILLERKKELLIRGLRWSDLRRLNKDNRFKVTITRNTPIGLFTLEPNSYQYTYPIPDDIISITGMQQNPGW